MPREKWHAVSTTWTQVTSTIWTTQPVSDSTADEAQVIQPLDVFDEGFGLPALVFSCTFTRRDTGLTPSQVRSRTRVSD
jgi:hypothetical protein